jgi:hypothetical protein
MHFTPSDGTKGTLGMFGTQIGGTGSSLIQSDNPADKQEKFFEAATGQTFGLMERIDEAKPVKVVPKEKSFTLKDGTVVTGFHTLEPLDLAVDVNVDKSSDKDENGMVLARVGRDKHCVKSHKIFFRSKKFELDKDQIGGTGQNTATADPNKEGASNSPQDQEHANSPQVQEHASNSAQDQEREWTNDEYEKYAKKSVEEAEVIRNKVIGVFGDEKNKSHVAVAVVVDMVSGTPYYGISGHPWPEKVNDTLAARSHAAREEAENWPPEGWFPPNCAEFKAVNKALNARKNLKNLVGTTMKVSDGKFDQRCILCQTTTAGVVFTSDRFHRRANLTLSTDSRIVG